MRHTTLMEVFAEVAEDHPATPALKWRSAAGWQSLTWRELRREVEAATLGLREFGVRPGDRVGILLSNRPELAVADLALLHARAVPVCLFDTFTDEQMATVLRTLGIDLVLAEGRTELDRLRGVDRSIVVDRDASGDTTWEQVMATGRELAGGPDFEAVWRSAGPDDVVSINYTSGTTGALKGVRHTHRNVLWHAESFGRFMPVPPGTRFLSYLPRAHATERFVTTWYPLTRAGTVHLCPDPSLLPEFLLDVRPQFFGGVQRVWEKMYAAARTTADAARLGLDECGFAFSGGGALAEPVQEFFAGIGVPLAEGWGQSELVSAATCGRRGELRIGTAGRPLPGVEVRTADDGELLVRSGSRMLGYVVPPAAGGGADTGGGDADTGGGGADTSGDRAGGGGADGDAGGWLHTGDLGLIDADGYVRLLGRRQEVFRLADGHLVSASRVESHLRANLLVDHACVVDEGAPDLCAILVIGAPPRTWSTEDAMRAVQEANRQLPARDRIARFVVLSERWLPGQAEELTHTGKLKRPLIAAKYATVIHELCHAGGGFAVR